MWKNILDSTLDFFANISTFADFLFQDFDLKINKPDNEFFQWLVGWFVDWVNSWGITFKPIGLFTIGTFLVFFGIWLVKMII